MTEKHYAVAIDGPSGAGKSTLARAAAEALHILYVDTGAIYRTIGVYMYRHDIQPTDAAAVTAAEVAEAPLAVAAEVLLARETTVLHRPVAREQQP